MDGLLVAAETTTALITAAAALGGTIIGGLITLISTWLQNRHAEGERKATATALRRNRAAEILGRVRTFLTDIEPERIGVNVNAETTPVMMQAYAGRLNTLRDELSIFAAGSEEDHLMDAVGKLEVSLFNTFCQVNRHARDLLSNGGGLDTYHAARKEHTRAVTLVRIVLDLVRGRDTSEIEAQLRRLDEAKPESDQ